MTKTKIQIKDLYRFKLISDPQISPDSNKVVFIVERMHKKDKTYYTNLFLVDASGGRSKQITFGKRNDAEPRWSPDGQTIAFIRKKETLSQIWLLPLSGGEAFPLTKLKRGRLSNLQWSPDGSKILFLYHPLGKEIEVDNDGKARTPSHRHITDIWFRLDGEGFFDSEYSHIWTTDVRTGRSIQLVNGDFHDSFPCWSPDGKTIAFISYREKDWQDHLEEQRIYTVPSQGGKIKQLPAPEGSKAGLSFSPDGNKLAYLGHQQPYRGWGVINYLLNTFDLKTESNKPYGKSLDRMALSLTLGDITPSFVMVSPIWCSNDKILYGVADTGTQLVVQADLQKDDVTKVTEPDLTAVSWSIDSKRKELVFAGASLGSPDELYIQGLEDKTTKQVTFLNRSYLNSRDFIVAEEIFFNNEKQELQGWLVKPPGFVNNKKYPLILNIHGGPRCQYGRTFFHEMQVLAASGYLVLYTNPRGSQGYGEKFADAITAKWGEPAMGDLMAAVDHVINMGIADADRLGVTGGSYGGYMTNWIVTHTDRFKAAVTQRCVSDLSSMFGNSDIGWDLANEFGGAPWENRSTYQDWSPITHIQDCYTPLLIIHSEQDLRCNIEQADQFYTALKYLKRTVEYVRFPEEPHGLSRHGRPDRREIRLQKILDWFNRYL